jgi:hypothetical protein
MHILHMFSKAAPGAAQRQQQQQQKQTAMHESCICSSKAALARYDATQVRSSSMHMLQLVHQGAKRLPELQQQQQQLRHGNQATAAALSPEAGHGAAAARCWSQPSSTAVSGCSCCGRFM